MLPPVNRTCCGSSLPPGWEGLAHALGLALVAEGVEDQETLDALAGLGCDVVQGYHLSRPLPAPAFEEWLDRREQAAALL